MKRILLLILISFGCNNLNHDNSSHNINNATVPNNNHNDSLSKEHEAFIKREKIKIDSLINAKNIEDKRNADDLKQWENTTKPGEIHKKHPDWSKDDCQRVVDRRVWIGMEYEMLLIERGLPNHIHTSNYGTGSEYQACWNDYNPSCFYFKSDHIITSYN